MRAVGATSSRRPETGSQPTCERKWAYFVFPSAGKRSIAASASPAEMALRFMSSAAAAKPGEPWTRWN